jgi:hypothetical protein
MELNDIINELYDEYEEISTISMTCIGRTLVSHGMNNESNIKMVKLTLNEMGIKTTGDKRR